MLSQFGKGLGHWLQVKFIVQGYNIVGQDNQREKDVNFSSVDSAIVQA